MTNSKSRGIIANMKKLLLSVILIALLIATAGFGAQDYVSASGDVTGLGTVAQGLTQPISAVRYAFNAGCYVLGVGFLVATIFRFQRFRQNPQEAPISSVLTLLIIALILIILPLSYQLSQYFSHDVGMSDMTFH